jgi:hypothetical protein
MVHLKRRVHDGDADGWTPKAVIPSLETSDDLVLPLTSQERIVRCELTALEGVKFGKFHIRTPVQGLNGLQFAHGFHPQRGNQRLAAEFHQDGFRIEESHGAVPSLETAKATLLKMHLRTGIGLRQWNRAARQIGCGQVRKGDQRGYAPPGDGLWERGLVEQGKVRGAAPDPDPKLCHRAIDRPQSKTEVRGKEKPKQTSIFLSANIRERLWLMKNSIRYLFKR